MWEITGHIRFKVPRFRGLGLYLKKIENEQIKAKYIGYRLE